MQATWGDLTDDVFDVREGNAEYLAGKLQEPMDGIASAPSAKSTISQDAALASTAARRSGSRRTLRY